MVEISKLWIAMLCCAALKPLPEAVPEPEFIRYSGADGVELQYAPSWSRSRATVPPREGEPAITLGISLADKHGNIVARFGYSHMDMSFEPVENRTAATLAKGIVEFVRSEAAGRVVKEPSQTTLGGREAWYFELSRPQKDGTAQKTRQWAMDWKGAHLLFTASRLGENAAIADPEIDRIVAGISFTKDLRKPDGTFIVFSDRAAGIRLSHPSHWHDEEPPYGYTAQWSAFNADGSRYACLRVVSGHLRTSQVTADAVCAKTAAGLRAAMTETSEDEVGPAEFGDLSGTQRTFTGRGEGGNPQKAYVCVLERDGRSVLVIATASTGFAQKFDREWEQVLASIRIDGKG